MTETTKIINDDIDEIEELMEELESIDSSKTGTAPVVKSTPIAAGLKSFLTGVNVTEDLKVDNQDLDSMLSSQAGLYAWYSVIATKAQFQYERAKANAGLVEAQQGSAIRAKYISDGKKASEKQIEAELVMSKAFQAAQSTMNKARQISGQCRAIAESMEQRQQMIIQACKRAELEIHMTGVFKSKEDRIASLLSRAKENKTA